MYSFGSASQADSQLARVLHICPDTDTSLSLFPEYKSVIYSEHFPPLNENPGPHAPIVLNAPCMYEVQ